MDKFQKARNLFKMNMVVADKRTRDGRLRTAHVSGSGAKSYHVILRRYNNHITTECQLLVGQNTVYCKSGRHICSHGLATVLTALDEANMTAALCRDEKIAKNLSNMGGHIVTVSKHGGTQVHYLVIKPK